MRKRVAVRGKEVMWACSEKREKIPAFKGNQDKAHSQPFPRKKKREKRRPP